MDGARGLPKYANSIANDLQKGIHSVRKRNIVDEITAASAVKYSLRVIIRVNKYESKAEGQKITPRKGMIKVSGLIHKREDKSDPRLAWLMFQQIYLMFHGI